MHKRTEHQIQVEFFAKLHLFVHDPELMAMIYAIPNGGRRPMLMNKSGKRYSSAVYLKREGVRKGVWDVSVDIPHEDFAGLKIEFKADIGKLTKEQRQYGARYKRLGYATRVCRTAHEALELVKQWVV